MKLKKVDLFFYLYRIFWMFFSLEVISKFTILGDYKRYSTKNFYEVIKEIDLGSTFITDLIFSFTRLILRNNLLLVNLFFSILSTYSILFLLKRLHYKKEILLLLLFPSFNIWSTYISKEILYVIFTSFFLGMYIDILRDLKFSKKKKILFIFLFTNILIMKKQYVIFWLLIIEYLILKKFFKIQIKKINYIYFLQSIIFIFILYLSKNIIDSFFKNFYLHFSNGNSSRNLDYFVEKNGFFKHIIYGIYISIQGIEIKEIFERNIIKIFSFLESNIILFYLMIKFLINRLYKKYFYLLSVLSLLIVQYPFAIFNSGSAIRYRTNIYIILIVLVYLFKNTKEGKNEKYIIYKI